MVYDTNHNALIFAGGAERPEPGNPHAEDYQHTWMLELDNIGAKWKEKAEIPFLSNHMSYTTVRDSAGVEHHMFLAGQVGENEFTGNIKDNYEYIVQTDTWVKHVDMPFTRGHASSSTRDIGCGLIIAGGSTNESGKTKDISFFDYNTKTWTKIGDLPNAINTPVCDISVDGYLYCESGWANGLFSYRRKIILEPYA